MKKTSLTIHSNGVVLKLQNKKIYLEENDNEELVLTFAFADENPQKPAVRHQCLKGKVRVSQIKLSHEAMRHLAYMYMEFLKSKP